MVEVIFLKHIAWVELNLAQDGVFALRRFKEHVHVQVVRILSLRYLVLQAHHLK